MSFGIRIFDEVGNLAVDGYDRLPTHYATVVGYGNQNTYGDVSIPGYRPNGQFICLAFGRNADNTPNPITWIDQYKNDAVRVFYSSTGSILITVLKL